MFIGGLPSPDDDLQSLAEAQETCLNKCLSFLYRVCAVESTTDIRRVELKFKFP